MRIALGRYSGYCGPPLLSREDGHCISKLNILFHLGRLRYCRWVNFGSGLGARLLAFAVPLCGGPAVPTVLLPTIFSLLALALLFLGSITAPLVLVTLPVIYPLVIVPGIVVDEFAYLAFSPGSSFTTQGIVVFEYRFNGFVVGLLFGRCSGYLP